MVKKENYGRKNVLIKTLPVGQIDTNCYIVTNEETLACVIIDPGDESNTILNYLERNHLKCEAIFLTHGHPDHTGAVKAIMKETGAPVYMCSRDDARVNGDPILYYRLPEGSRYYDEGDVLRFAGLTFEILSTPGHTPGGVCIICENALFVGDTLFRGSCGRTDLNGGDIVEELKSLRRLCMLPGDYEVYPGHMDTTTLERERRFNFYCREAMSRSFD